MASGIQSGVLDEHDLHALVDGHVEDERRTALRRRLASSPVDRARIEAWQGQNELLRATFAGVEREPLPAVLDLSPKARLQCIPANDAPLVEPASATETKSARRIRIAACVATVVVIAVGLGGSWLLLDASRPETSATPVAVQLAQPVRTDSTQLPTKQIPDLSVYGLQFIAAETTPDPTTIRFHYEDGSSRVTVSVTHASVRADTAPRWTQGALAWQHGSMSFAVTGTTKQDRLEAIAGALHRASD